MSVVSMNLLLEAGVHFGHQTRRWNPKMEKYIYTSRNGIYIIDLQKTVKKIEESYKALNKIAANGGKVLFVGTKKQAQEAVQEEAVRSNSYFVNQRWLGGTLTNFKTIRRRIRRMEEIEKMEKDGIFAVLPKKEVIALRKEHERLERFLGGIRDMVNLPDALFIIDPRKERNAILEARILGIPVFGIVDTNCDPDDVDYVVPANDDAIRAVKLIVGVMANAVVEAQGGEIVDYTTKRENTDNRGERRERRDNNYRGDRRDNRGERRDNNYRGERRDNRGERREFNNDRREFNNDRRNDRRHDRNENEVKKEVVKTEQKVETVEINFNDMTLKDLKEIAKERGIKGYSTLKKQELIDALK